jgi:chromosome partitioning related protein ParA
MPFYVLSVSPYFSRPLDWHRHRFSSITSLLLRAFASSRREHLRKSITIFGGYEIMPAKIYGVICTKGGVGKTTTAANLGGILADMGQRTLLVDCDPQQTLSRVYKILEPAQSGLIQLYQNASAQGCISKTNIANLDIVVNNDPGKDPVVATFLRQSFYHIHHLWKALFDLKSDYDYIIIDTQGAKGIIQESVMFAADALLSPVQPNGLDGREFITGTVESYRQMQPKPGFPSITGRPVPPMKVVINMVDRTIQTDAIIKNLRKYFDAEADGLITVLNTVIPDLASYKQATPAGVPVHRYETSRHGPTLAALHIMTQLVHELEPKLIDVTPRWVRS